MADAPKRIVVEGLGRLPQFSHAVVAGGLVFVSGTLGTLPGSFADMADFAAMNAAWSERFGSEPPARITVGGAQLVLGARVEIECVAALREPR